jgi:APA family basic amino acid/polyamine antiporter
VGQQKPTVFVRDATGLVRQFGATEHFITNLNGVVPIFAPAFTAWFIWYAIPGGSVAWATIGSFLFAACGFVTAYAMMCATFPRSAAPYVAQSRILTPWFAWPAESMMWLSILSFSAIVPSGYVITWGLSPGLYMIGTLTNNPALVSLASWTSSPAGIIVVGTLFLIVGIIPAILGTRILLRTFQMPMFVIATLGLIVTLGLLAGSTHAQFVANFNQIESPLTYDGLVAMGQQLNPQAFVPESLAAVTMLFAIGTTTGSVNSYWNSYAVGEMKRADNVRNQVISMVVPSFILTLCIIAIVQMETNIVGRDQLIALTQIGTLGASSLPNSLFGGGVVTISIPYILAGNVWVVAFLMISIIAAAWCFMPINWLLASRDPFAWAIDRLVPAKFAEVSDRFHTPIFSYIFAFIITEIFLVVAATTSLLGLLFSVTWAWSTMGVAATCLACIFLPMRKLYYNQSPVKWKLAGIPVVSIVGLIGLIFCIDVFATFALVPALGFGGPLPWILLASYLIVFVLYWVVKYIRKCQGIDINLAFGTIPPE